MRIRGASIALVLVLGCQDYKFEQKCPEVIEEQQQTRLAGKPKPADILFVVDNSCSMEDEQDNLAANFEAFINTIAVPDADYRIAVVTTDQDRSGGRRFETIGRATPVLQYEPGLDRDVYARSDTTGCRATDIEIGCFRGPNADERVIDSTMMDPAQQIEAFTRNVAVGSCGSGDEVGLTAMVDVLGQPCNGGFLRDDANLVVIIVSDEDDQGTASGPAQFIQDLKRIKPIEKTRIAVIVGAQDGEADNCSIDIGAECGSLCAAPGPTASTRTACTPATASAVCPAHERCYFVGEDTYECLSVAAEFWADGDTCAWCSYFPAEDCCAARRGTRYVEFARAFEQALSAEDASFGVHDCQAAPGTENVACLVDSICQASFATTLERIAKDLVFDPRYDLDPPALNPEGVRVRVIGGRFGEEGRELVPGEEFTATADLVELDREFVPAEGERVEIYFVTDVEKASDRPRGACGI